MIVNLKEQHCENFLQSLHKEQWQEVRLGEVAEINPKETLRKHYLYKKVAMDNLEPYTKRIYSFNIESFNGGAKFRNGDTLLARITPCLENGKTAFVDFLQDDEIAFGSTEFIVLREKAATSNKDFLYYLARSKHFREVAIKSMTGSSGRERVQIEVLRDFTFLLPPLTIQQKIAEILSSFDDKIDLLHRQNKTLESLALTLFRHYFIDNPKRNEWELGKLGDYVKIIDNRGKTPPFTTDITPYPLIEVNALSDDSMLINYDIVRKYVIKETYQNWFREHIKQYDILFSTVGSIGEVAMLLDNKGCIAQNVIGFRARDISPFYLYEWLKYMQQEIKEFDIGSVQPSIKVTHFIEKQIYKPDSKTLESFDKQMLLITDKISHNAKQIQNLQAMRDILLKAIFE